MIFCLSDKEISVGSQGTAEVRNNPRSQKKTGKTIAEIRSD